MKRFKFRLESVKRLREQQLSVEENRLEQLNSVLRALDARRSALESEQTAHESAVLSDRIISADRLHCLETFRQFATKERRRIARERADTVKRTDEQRAAVLEARRKFELLNRLAEKERDQWRKDLDREIEQHAAESYLARHAAAI